MFAITASKPEPLQPAFGAEVMTSFGDKGHLLRSAERNGTQGLKIEQKENMPAFHVSILLN
ncbi:Uncharacterised protein [Serratia grimesii]|nr:Uncharacterised protein [Serratia grimesii]